MHDDTMLTKKIIITEEWGTVAYAVQDRLIHLLETNKISLEDYEIENICGMIDTTIKLMKINEEIVN